MNRDVWVLLEAQDNKIKPSSATLMDEGKRLSSELGGELHGVMFGQTAEGVGERVGRHGGKHLYLFRQESLDHYLPNLYERLLTGLLLKEKPFLFLAEASSLGSDLMPRVAAKLKSPLVTNCVEILVKEDVEFIKPVQNGRLHATLVCKGTGIRMATLHPKVLTVSEAKKETAVAQVEEIKAVIEEEGPIRVTGFLKADHRMIDIGEAEVILAVGRGMGPAENFERVKRFSDELQAAIGGTRPVIDAGILPFERQIGQTGKMVSPKLILLCGISGAMEFTKGIEGAGAKVAINMDRQAPIFRSVDFGIVSDLNALIPKILDRMEKRRREKKG
jgi:electron transfer flavoprotein alpha subunit